MSRSKRKIDHINYALSTATSGSSGFEDLTFVHQSLPDLSVDEVSLHSKLGELNLSSPFYINAMTGGGGEKTEKLNEGFALAAKETGLMLSVGSQMAAIKDSSERRSYSITRKVNPKGIIVGNLGSEATLDQAKAAVDMIEADALQIHLNVIQELAMPEGDRSFTGALGRIEKIVTGLEVPVIVKETGFGMSRETVKKLENAGVSIIDVGGYGGTNFSRIENYRQQRELTFFNDWGITTTASIVEAKSSFSSSVIASGGIKNSLEVIKALSLGADAAGIAGAFLKIVIDEGPEALVEEIQQMQREQKVIMTALGARNTEQLKNTSVVISGPTYHWLKSRGLEPERFAVRST
ncbi:type 2 isopentenyl-diphosphate Delta-isomerase [Jeotgalibacillus proteolyticus]|uniref:Isopentenyl-diphosphate delta-isomerase n=1 Tax=Jeotgalibacillus proteolyticus TaxID=2082395 RepID=A0A2S5GED7_9BACL|nr:type 2 isopentenyl-diphosphate Delta-isomerase [Jeotgalibacillus proteolyticus]PPA71275.1 type 2 isopentenyl-diphosphate Delta-isomerase [Jeotgalibacillus proteolyticus]